MRKVIVKIKSNELRGEEVEKEAWFHAWGASLVKCPDGTAFAETLAIVESVETGKVRMVDPEKVKFIDKPE